MKQFLLSLAVVGFSLSAAHAAPSEEGAARAYQVADYIRVWVSNACYNGGGVLDYVITPCF